VRGALLLSSGQQPLLTNKLAVKLCQTFAKGIFRLVLMAAVMVEVVLGCLLPLLPGRAFSSHLSLTSGQLSKTHHEVNM
jgi:hypothetical protein